MVSHRLVVARAQAVSQRQRQNLTVARRFFV